LSLNVRLGRHRGNIGGIRSSQHFYPVTDAGPHPKIDLADAWTRKAINLFISLDDLHLKNICKSIKWIKIYVEDNPEWETYLMWSRDIILKACSSDLHESMRGDELSLINGDKTFTGGPIVLAVICKHLSASECKGSTQQV